MQYLILDIETAPRPDADTDAAYAEADRQPPANYKNPEAIAKWHEADRAKWRETLGLSPATGRVVAVGTQLVTITDRGSVNGGLAMTLEASGLRHCGDLPEWHLLDYTMNDLRNVLKTGGAVVTFNGKAFDLPFLALRCAAMDIPLSYRPSQLHKKYATAQHLDLYEIITGGGSTRFSGHGLTALASSWQLGVEPFGSGADVARWVEAGDLDSVAKHLTADVEMTTALLLRLYRTGWL